MTDHEPGAGLVTCAGIWFTSQLRHGKVVGPIPKPVAAHLLARLSLRLFNAFAKELAPVSDDAASAPEGFYDLVYCYPIDLKPFPARA